MVHMMWLECVWRKCLEITLVYKRGPQHQLLQFYRPVAVRAHCLLGKHGQRLQTLWLYHKTHHLYDRVTSRNHLITRQFSPCTEKRISGLSSQTTNAIIQRGKDPWFIWWEMPNYLLLNLLCSFLLHLSQKWCTNAPLFCFIQHLELSRTFQRIQSSP